MKAKTKNMVLDYVFFSQASISGVFFFLRGGWTFLLCVKWKVEYGLVCHQMHTAKRVVCHFQNCRMRFKQVECGIYLWFVHSNYLLNIIVIWHYTNISSSCGWVLNSMLQFKTFPHNSPVSPHRQQLIGFYPKNHSAVATKTTSETEEKCLKSLHSVLQNVLYCR